MEIKRQMRGIERQAVLFQVRLSLFLEVTILLRSPFYAVMNNEEVNAELMCSLERGNACIDSKADPFECAGRTGPHLQAVQGSIPDLSDPQLIIQEADDIP